MAFLTRLRHRINLQTLHHHRHFSSILSKDSKTILTSKQKTKTALSLLKTEKNPEKILDICRAASLTPEFHLDRIAFSLAISNLTTTQSFSTIHSFLQELKHRPDLHNERFLSHSIILYGQAGMLDHGIKTFKEMHSSNITPTTKSLNALLISCLIARKHSEANRIFNEFPKDYNISPNIDTYNIVIKSHCESGNASNSYSVLAEMERKGCKPNATTFGNMLAGFYAEEKYQDVGKVLELMGKHGQKPSLSTYNIRIQSLCKLKRSNEAKALFEGLVAKGVKVNAVTYHHLIHGFGKEGNLEEVKALFNDMRRKGCEPDSQCYFTLIYYLCLGGDFETALKACKGSIAKKWFPNYSTMKKLIEGLVSVSKVEEARELVAIMKERFSHSENANLWTEVEQSLPQ